MLESQDPELDVRLASEAGSPSVDLNGNFVRIAVLHQTKHERGPGVIGKLRECTTAYSRATFTVWSSGFTKPAAPETRVRAATASIWAIRASVSR